MTSKYSLDDHIQHYLTKIEKLDTMINNMGLNHLYPPTDEKRIKYIEFLITARQEYERGIERLLFAKQGVFPDKAVIHAAMNSQNESSWSQE
jgi:hypothetical protein